MLSVDEISKSLVFGCSLKWHRVFSGVNCVGDEVDFLGAELNVFWYSRLRLISQSLFTCTRVRRYHC